MNKHSKNPIPIFLALIGLALVVFGSARQFLPLLPADPFSNFRWPPSITIQRYPDASIVFLDSPGVSRDLDFAMVMQNQSFLDSLAQRKIKHRWLEPEQSEAKQLKTLATPPAMLFVKPLGGDEYELLATRPLPKTSKEANAFIAEVMAK